MHIYMYFVWSTPYFVLRVRGEGGPLYKRSTGNPDAEPVSREGQEPHQKTGTIAFCRGGPPEHKY